VSSTSPRPGPSRVAWALRNGAHLSALSALAVAQPLFDLLGRNAEFFVVRHSHPTDIVVFALAVTLGPPALVLLVEALAGLLHPGLREAIHLTAVGGLVALILMQALNRLGDLSSAALLPLAALAAVVAALAYRRFAVARAFLGFLAPAALLFLALFLLASPVAHITLASEAHARAAGVSSRAPVVMIVFDEFPLLSLLDERGEIDVARYPNFAALARGSTWFSRTVSISGDTTQAVPAILTGRFPDEGRLPFYPDHPENLFTLLGDSHRMRVVEPITSLCPERLCPRAEGEGFLAREQSLFSDTGIVYLHTVLPHDLRDRLPSLNGTWMNFSAGGDIEPNQSARWFVRARALSDLTQRDEQARAFIAAIQPSERPTLYFLHVLLPHHPWRYLPSGREYATATLIPGLLEGDRWGPDPFLPEQAYQRHLLQVGFVDRLVGELVAHLRAVGLYDRSLVVLTADHGVSFRASAPRRVLTEENVAELGLVPFFLKAPGQRRGAVVDAQVGIVDVLPTIADALGIELPWKVDGRSALGRTRPAPTPDLERQLAAGLARKNRLFGHGLYRIGPYPQLIGQRVTDLRPLVATGLGAELTDPGPLSPVHIVGTLKGTEQRAGVDVAVAVNGRIAALGRTFMFRGQPRFEAIVPEAAFRPGRNDVHVYVVSAQGDDLRLLIAGLAGRR
jgi:hypothetical protein